MRAHFRSPVFGQPCCILRDGDTHYPRWRRVDSGSNRQSPLINKTVVGYLYRRPHVRQGVTVHRMISEMDLPFTVFLVYNKKRNSTVVMSC